MDIKLYISPNCDWCKKIKTWLKRRRLPLEIYDITESEDVRDQVIEKTHQMIVPVTEINGEIIVGFDEEKLEKAIAKAKADE